MLILYPELCILILAHLLFWYALDEGEKQEKSLWTAAAYYSSVLFYNIKWKTYDDWNTNPTRPFVLNRHQNGKTETWLRPRCALTNRIDEINTTVACLMFMWVPRLQHTMRQPSLTHATCTSQRSKSSGRAQWQTHWASQESITPPCK
jgi:hypothetical protein